MTDNKKSSLPEFSFLIVTRNRRDLLQKQIAHIIKELIVSEFEYEIKVYDDYSDNPLTIDSALLSPKISLVNGIQRVGLIAARNELLKAVRAEIPYVVFLDDDLFVFNLNNVLAAAKDSFIQGFAGISIPYVNLPVLPATQVSRFKQVFRSMNNGKSEAFFHGGSSVFQRKIFDSLGYLESLYFFALEEEDFSLRLFAQGHRLRTIFNGNFIGIHDQAGDKNWKERNVFLLSNRLLYHWKFIRNAYFRLAFNVLYIFLYVIKVRSMAALSMVRKRYLELKPQIKKEPLKTSVFIKFMIRRYLSL